MNIGQLIFFCDLLGTHLRQALGSDDLATAKGHVEAALKAMDEVLDGAIKAAQAESDTE